MSRKRYTLGQKRGSPYKGIKIRHHHKKATKGNLTQRSAQQGHLLIRKSRGNYLKTLFIRGSKLREGETEDLLFRRLISCRVEREREYGINEILKMKKVGMRINISGRCNKYAIIKAHSQQQEKNLIDFQLDVIRNDQYLTQCAVRFNL